MLKSALGCQLLGKRHPTQVVLIHGLFANAGFWVPYLSSFDNVQLTLLTVDYAALLESGAPLQDVAALADQLIGDKPGHLVGHSFGCWLGMYLRARLLSRSFICPTFAALEFRAAPFCADISERLATDPAAAATLVERALDYQARYLGGLRYRATDHLYLPTDDPYCGYVERPNDGVAERYPGGHFDVAPAVAMIAGRRSLLSAERAALPGEWPWLARRAL